MIPLPPSPLSKRPALFVPSLPSIDEYSTQIKTETTAQTVFQEVAKRRKQETSLQNLKILAQTTPILTAHSPKPSKSNLEILLEILKKGLSKNEIEEETPEVKKICDNEFIKQLIEELTLPPSKETLFITNACYIKYILDHPVYSENENYSSSAIAREILEKLIQKKNWPSLKVAIHMGLLGFFEKEEIDEISSRLPKNTPSEIVNWICGDNKSSNMNRSRFTFH